MDSCKLKHDHEPYLGSFVGAITKKMQDDFNKDAGNTKAFVRFNNAMICPRGKIKAVSDTPFYFFICVIGENSAMIDQNLKLV